MNTNKILLVSEPCMPPEGHDPLKAEIHILHEIRELHRKTYHPNPEDSRPHALDQGKPIREITFKIY